MLKRKTPKVLNKMVGTIYIDTDKITGNFRKIFCKLYFTMYEGWMFATDDRKLNLL